jgi:hypothetical protein
MGIVVTVLRGDFIARMHRQSLHCVAESRRLEPIRGNHVESPEVASSWHWVSAADTAVDSLAFPVIQPAATPLRTTQIFQLLQRQLWVFHLPCQRPCSEFSLGIHLTAIWSATSPLKLVTILNDAEFIRLWKENKGDPLLLQCVLNIEVLGVTRRIRRYVLKDEKEAWRLRVLQRHLGDGSCCSKCFQIAVFLQFEI